MSYKKDGEIHIDSVDAKGGSREGVVRWVLLISIVAAIVLLGAIALFGGLSQGDVEEEITASAIEDERSSDQSGDGGVAVATEAGEPSEAQAD